MSQCTFLKLPRLAILFYSASFCFFGEMEIHSTDEVLTSLNKDHLLSDGK